MRSGQHYDGTAVMSGMDPISQSQCMGAGLVGIRVGGKINGNFARRAGLTGIPFPSLGFFPVAQRGKEKYIFASSCFSVFIEVYPSRNGVVPAKVSFLAEVSDSNLAVLQKERRLFPRETWWDFGQEEKSERR
ncbi:hypothetical protein SRHO_G00115960 [Serrasalmus rhombeus]